jgi:hypothetical protein
VWEGRWGLYKGPQRPPASRISSPTAARTRVQPYIGLFPLDVCLRPLQRGGRGQGYRVPTARVITPRARVESQRGELRTGTGMRPRVSGLAIYRLFPPKACLCPLQRGGRGQGCCGRLTHLRLEKTPRACSVPILGTLKHSFFGLSQPKSKRFTPPWGLEIFACGNLKSTNEHASPVDIGICAAERGPHPRLLLASAHCPSGRRQCRCPGKPVRECAVPRAL